MNRFIYKMLKKNSETLVDLRILWFGIEQSNLKPFNGRKKI